MHTTTRILFTEGIDPRVLHACRKLLDKQLLHPIVYGNRSAIQEVAKQQQIMIDDFEILDPSEFHEKKMILRILELRKGKVDRSVAETWIEKDTYFCTMYVEMGYACFP